MNVCAGAVAVARGMVHGHGEDATRCGDEGDFAEIRAES